MDCKNIFMVKNRKKIIERIFQILTYLKNQRLINLLKENIDTFSIEELEQIQAFLETWDNKYLYEFLNEIIKKSTEISTDLKNLNISKKKEEKKKEEETERKKEENEIEKLINF